MKKFAVEYLFNLRASTSGWTIEAESEDEAAEKAKQAIDKYGNFDIEKFESLGGVTSSWSVHDGTDFDYELDEIEEITDD